MVPNEQTRRRIIAGIREEAMPLVTETTGPSDFDLDPDAKPGAEKSRPAAVLVPLIERPDGITVLLTQRTEHLNSHAGQVSFPGGRVEAQDSGPVDTALRETKEEVGLDRAHVSIAGYLDTYKTRTGFHVTPVVGFVAPRFELEIDTFEVAEAFEVPLSFLFNPDNHQRHSRVYNGARRHYFAMPYGKYYIWGATAGMLMNFYRRVHGLI